MDEWLNKWWYTLEYLLRNKKKQNIDTSNNLNESPEKYT